jgi:FkbM family methyltransferase
VAFTNARAPEVRRSVVSYLKGLARPYAPAISLPWRGPSWTRALRLLRTHAIVPATVFDIGVAYGTFPLYRAFPDAFYHLIDPAAESLACMEKLSRRLSCQIYTLALGDRDGEAALEVREDFQESTLFQEEGPRRARRVDRVAMRRFDSLFGPIKRPALVKIDVQGAELMVLEGMTGRLPEVDALIVETSTIATIKDGPEVAEVVRFMAGHGFALVDVLGLRRRPLDGATAQLDLMFAPQSGALRRDRRWAAAA